MNLDKKLEIAQEYALEMARQGITLKSCHLLGWKHADLMEKEYTKRKIMSDNSKFGDIRRALHEGFSDKTPVGNTTPKQHQCNCSHWKGCSTFMGETHTCSDCGGWIII